MNAPVELVVVEQKSKLPLEFFITKVANHDAIKKQVLEALKYQGKYGINNYAQKIYNTDWHLNSTFNRSYIDVVRPVFAMHLDMLKAAHGYNAVALTNIWYQQYKTGDYHSEHTHPRCTFSSVYYVNLPNDAPKTQFRLKGKNYMFDVEEGNIITFPSLLIHQSPPNQSKGIKTVIAFNADAIYGLPDVPPKGSVK